MKDYSPERLDVSNDNNIARAAAHVYRYELSKKVISHKYQFPKILDIACGTGYGSQTLSEITKSQVFGVDVSSEAVSQAIAGYARKNIHFKLGSIIDIPYKNKFFDAVVCFETIEHIQPGLTLKALSEMKRVLKRGGTLFISTPNKLVEDVAKYLFKIDNVFHTNEMTYQLLRNSLKKSRLKIIKEYGQGPIFLPVYPLVRFGLFPKAYFKPIAFFPPFFSMFMIVECEKNNEI